MGLIAINKTDIEYTLKSDNSEDKTVFKLGVFDSQEKLYVHSKILNTKLSNTEDVVDETVYIPLVKFGLKGWANLKYADGKQVDFETVETTIQNIGKRKVIKDDLLNLLDMEWIVELGEEIFRLNFLTPEEKKS